MKKRKHLFSFGGIVLIVFVIIVGGFFLYRLNATTASRNFYQKGISEAETVKLFKSLRISIKGIKRLPEGIILLGNNKGLRFTAFLLSGKENEGYIVMRLETQIKMAVDLERINQWNSKKVFLTMAGIGENTILMKADILTLGASKEFMKENILIFFLAVKEGYEYFFL